MKKKPAPIPHYCHAQDCKVVTSPELLMCPRHWKLVPKAIQQAVWRHYRRGQCDDKRPSRRWCVAADEAVTHIAKLEGRTVHVTFVAAYWPKEDADG